MSTDVTGSRFTPINDSYATCERTYAALRIYSSTFEPEYFSEILRLTPTGQQAKGELRIGFRNSQRRVPITGWFLSSEEQVQSKDIRRHLDWLLASLLPRKDELKKLQSEGDIKMAVSCIWWSVAGQGGPTLWPEQMKGLAELNLECSFDISFFGEDDE